MSGPKQRLSFNLVAEVSCERFVNAFERTAKTSNLPTRFSGGDKIMSLRKFLGIEFVLNVTDFSRCSVAVRPVDKEGDGEGSKEGCFYLQFNITVNHHSHMKYAVMR